MKTPRTHCKNGHELTPDTIGPKGYCKLCQRVAVLAHRQRQQAAREASKARLEAAKAERAAARWVDRVAARGPLTLPDSRRNRQTHCRNGHELTLENTYIQVGLRVCRTCALARSNAHYAKRKAKPEPPGV